jgi:hypothetical protein
MSLKTQLTFAEATAFQASFDAVVAGTATWAQAKEVQAVMEGFDHLREIGNKAGQIIDARINQLDGVPEEKHAAMIAVLDGPDAAAPRIVYDADIRQIGTADEVTAEKAARAEAAAAEAKAAEQANLARPVEGAE